MWIQHLSQEGSTLDGSTLDGSTNPIHFIDFLKNPMKLKQFWFGGGGRAGSAPLKPTTAK